MSRAIKESESAAKEICATIKEEWPKGRRLAIRLHNDELYTCETGDVYVGKNYAWIRVPGGKLHLPYESISSVLVLNKGEKWDD